MNVENKLLKTINQAIREGVRAIKETRARYLSIEHKTYKEFVTNCDIASEKAIVNILKIHYPDSSILSEELGDVLGNDSLLWSIDPIDGTHNFIHNIPFYAISIGAFLNKEVVAGMIYLPEFEACYYAAKGKGAFLNDKKISVSTRELKESMVAYDNQFHKHPAMMKNLPKIVDNCFTLRIFGSAAVDIAKVAEGGLEARIFHKTKFEDYAAGAIIIREAGGKITDFAGRDVSLETRDVIVSNGRIHEQLLQLLNKLND